MKRVFLSMMLFASMVLGANAQTIVTNNYDSPITGDTSDDDDAETISAFNLTYYNLGEGLTGYGASDTWLNPKSFGIDWNLRMGGFGKNEMSYYNCDLGINYSYPVYKAGDLKVLGVAAVGPSVGTREAYNKEGKKKDKFFFDAFLDVRATVIYGNFGFSIGYFRWAPKFKFGDEAADGLKVSLSYDI